MVTRMVLVVFMMLLGNGRAGIGIRRGGEINKGTSENSES